MSTNPFIERMQQMVNGFNSGDIEPVVAAFAQDGVWHVGGSNRTSGTYRGREEIRTWFTAMTQEMGTAPNLELLDALADDLFMAFFLRGRFERGDHRIDMTIANAWRMDNGEFVEGWFLPEDPDAFDAFVG